MSSSSRNPTPKRKAATKKGKVEPPEEVKKIDAELAKAFDQIDPANGKKVGNAKFGIYAFVDFDEEPIYVGQTNERLRTRIRRHLTNRRTDAVAMFVLDPFEVKTVLMWPLWHMEGLNAKDKLVKAELDQHEFNVFEKLRLRSEFKAVLNEKDVPGTVAADPGEPFESCIIPDDMIKAREHADTRIARRASTIAKLSQVISERKVSTGLRRTLRTQAKRLEWLAAQRFEEAGGDSAVEKGTDDGDDENLVLPD